MNIGNFDLPPGLGIIIDYDVVNPGNFAIVFGCGPGVAYQDPAGFVEIEAGAASIELDDPAATIEYDHWEPSWNLGFSWDGTSSGHHQFRVVIPASELTFSGSMVKIKLGTYGANSYDIEHCTIGERSGTSCDFASTPTRITFDSGNNGCTVPEGGKWSDEIVFAIDETKDYLIHLDVGTGNHPYDNTTGDACYYNGSSGEEFTLDVTMSAQGYHLIVEEVDVWIGDAVMEYEAAAASIPITGPAATYETIGGGGLFFAQG